MKSENLITTGIALGVTSWPGSIPQPLVFFFLNPHSGGSWHVTARPARTHWNSLKHVGWWITCCVCPRWIGFWYWLYIRIYIYIHINVYIYIYIHSSLLGQHKWASPPRLRFPTALSTLNVGESYHYQTWSICTWLFLRTHVPCVPFSKVYDGLWRHRRSPFRGRDVEQWVNCFFLRPWKSEPFGHVVVCVILVYFSRVS